MSTAPGLLLSGLSAADPPGGLTYPLALRRDGFHGVQSMFGIVVGFLAFAIFRTLILNGRLTPRTLRPVPPHRRLALRMGVSRLPPRLVSRR